MCAIVTLSSCKKEFLVDVTGSITGVSRDYVTSQPVTGVTVSLVLNNKTMLKSLTDSLGYYTIAGVPVGDYTVLFSRSGYATSRTTIHVQPSNAVQNTTTGKKQSYQIGVVDDAIMYPTLGKITGVVTYLDGENAKGTTVVLAFNGYNINYEPSVYTTTTDNNGVYNFTNIPLGISVNVTAYNATASGIATMYGLDITSNSVPVVGNISISNMPFSLVNYTGKGDTVKVDTMTTQIKLIFSEPVSKTLTLAHTNGGAFLSVDGASVLATFDCASNIVTLTLPNTAHLTSGKMYTIDYNVYSSSNKNSNGTVTFITKEKGALITEASAPLLSYVSTTEMDITNLPVVSGGVVNGYLATYALYFKPKTGDQTEFRNVTSDFSLTASTGLVKVTHTGAIPLGTYYIEPMATGFDGVTVYGGLSNMLPVN